MKLNEKDSPPATVSIIIPVYNVAPYLREALDSAVNQTWRSLDIIMIDDGSTDGSASICDEYASDPRVTVVHRENGGLSSARNAGLDLARGDYIAFLDPDDAYAPAFIETLMGAIRNADIALCRYTVRETEGRLGSSDKWTAGIQSEPRAKPGLYGREDALRGLADGTMNWSVWNKLYKRELWESVRFPDGHNYEDVDAMYRIFDLCTGISVADVPLYCHRKRPGSITRTYSRKNLEDWKLALSHVDAFVRANTPGIFSWKQRARMHHAWLNALMVHYYEQPPVVRKELRREIISAGQEIGIGNCGIRTGTAYRMIRFCPRLFLIAYPVYRLLRPLVSQRESTGSNLTDSRFVSQ